MGQNQLRKNLWNDAGKAGLVLGGVSSAYMFISQFLSTTEIPGFLSALIGLLLWTAKFGGCIWLMTFFMKKFAVENTEAENSATFRFGMVTAILSALVYSAVSLANVAFISADMYTEQTNMIMQQMAGMMDSNTMSQMEKTIQNLPQLTFFSNLIYCSIYGTLLSGILSRNIPSKNPFADHKQE